MVCHGHSMYLCMANYSHAYSVHAMHSCNAFARLIAFDLLQAISIAIDSQIFLESHQ